MSSPRGTEAMEHLLASPFLEGFDPRDLAELARRATVVSFDQSEPVFTQGNPATCLYLLVAGTVELSVGGEVGPRLVVQTVTDDPDHRPHQRPPEPRVGAGLRFQRLPADRHQPGRLPGGGGRPIGVRLHHRRPADRVALVGDGLHDQPRPVLASHRELDRARHP